MNMQDCGSQNSCIYFNMNINCATPWWSERNVLHNTNAKMRKGTEAEDYFLKI